MNFNLHPRRGAGTAPFKVVQSVLVVESDDKLAKNIKNILREMNHLPLNTVNNLADMELSIQNNNPDLIIINIDIQGEFDGYQIAKILKLDYEVPFCILYDEKVNNLKKWADELNPDYFITSPSNQENLVKQLEEIMN